MPPINYASGVLFSRLITAFIQHAAGGGGSITIATESEPSAVIERHHLTPRRSTHTHTASLTPRASVRRPNLLSAATGSHSQHPRVDDDGEHKLQLQLLLNGRFWRYRSYQKLVEFYGIA